MGRESSSSGDVVAGWRMAWIWGVVKIQRYNCFICYLEDYDYSGFVSMTNV